MVSVATFPGTRGSNERSDEEGEGRIFYLRSVAKTIREDKLLHRKGRTGYTLLGTLSQT